MSKMENHLDKAMNIMKEILNKSVSNKQVV